MCIEVRQEEAYTIFEERRNGVTIRQVTDYLNKYFRDYFHEKREIKNMRYQQVLFLQRILFGC